MSSYKNLNRNRTLIDNVINNHLLGVADINKKESGQRITYSIRFHDKTIKTALLLHLYIISLNLS